MPYRNVKNLVTHARKKKNPEFPHSIKDMGEALQKKENQAYLQYNWRQSSFSAEIVEAVDKNDGSVSTSLVLADRAWVKHVLKYIEDDTVHIFSDGTFSIKPSHVKCTQLFKVEVCCFNQGIPLAYAVMERRTTQDYVSVIGSIVHQFAPELLQRNVKIYQDFELASRAGWGTILPRKEFIPCHFHWSQIQWRNLKRLKVLRRDKTLKKKNLSDEEKKRKIEEDKIIAEIKDTMNFIFAMPLLPLNEKADDTLLDVIIEGLSEKVKERMDPYFQYFRKNWLSSKNPASDWNVSEQKFRTNNFSESGNRKMNSFVGQKNPRPWTCVQAIIAYHNFVANTFSATVGSFDEKKEEKLEKYYKLLKTGKLGRLEFLTKVSDVRHIDYDAYFDENIICDEDSGDDAEEYGTQQGCNEDVNKCDKNYFREVNQSPNTTYRKLGTLERQEAHSSQEYPSDRYLPRTIPIMTKCDLKSFVHASNAECRTPEKEKLVQNECNSVSSELRDKKYGCKVLEKKCKFSRKQELKVINRERTELEFERIDVNIS